MGSVHSQIVIGVKINVKSDAEFDVEFNVCEVLNKNQHFLNAILVLTFKKLLALSAPKALVLISH